MGVKVGQSDYGKIHRFIHGDTFHNFQIREEGLYTVPTAYYIEGGSIHTAVEATRKIAGDNMDVAVVGLGAGAMTCYQNPGESWTFYEIDPAVVDLARNNALFSYIDRCDPDADIRIGDARQKLAELPEGSQDLIVIDAFSSDSIPAHLVTREALQMYQTRLKPTGIIFFHTSNTLLDVTSVVARMADDANLASRYLEINEYPDNPYGDMGLVAQGMLVGKQDLIERVSAGDPNFLHWEPSKYVKVWTATSIQRRKHCFSSEVHPVYATRANGSRSARFPRQNGPGCFNLLFALCCLPTSARSSNANKHTAACVWAWPPRTYRSPTKHGCLLLLVPVAGTL